MSQPLLGTLATAIAIAVSLAFISLFEFATFAGTVSFFLLCLIPTQIVMVVIWGAKVPFAPGLGQPGTGIVLLTINLLIGALLTPLVLQVVGEGISPPGPVPSHFAIIAVPTTFCLAIMFGGWPFTAVIRNRVAAGLGLLATSYAITFVLFRTFFGYGFLEGTPADLTSAPDGPFNAVMALVFDVTCLAVMFLVLCFDLWPFTRWPRLMKQPVLGIAWTLVALAAGGALMYAGIGVMGADPMIFLTRVSVPFIFGSIIVLNMLQGRLGSGLAQPLKGLANATAALAIGVALASIYGRLAPVVTGSLPSGPPGYEYEIWLANALLSVTFPFLIYLAAFFAYWPIPAAREVPKGEGAAAS